MKKIYYLLSCVIAAGFFASCNPMDNTYKTLDDNPSPKNITYTITAADTKAALPKTAAAYTAGIFTSVADAKANVPTVLNYKFPQYANGSVAAITYMEGVKPADSLYTNIAYTVTTADYANASSVTNTTFKDYSDAQVLLFLTWKYPTPVANQLSVLTYNYYLSGVTPSAGTVTTDSFLYLDGAWTKLYTISPAQYASVGRSNYNEFVAADQANLPGIFNTFLKNDPSVSATAKIGNIKYVSYNYYASKDYQRIMPMVFDGTNWTYKGASLNTSGFVKKNGTWIPDPTIYYTLKSSDWKIVGNSTAGTTNGRSNFAQYGDFNQQTTSQYYWSDADIQAAILVVLKADFPNPVANNPYTISYLVYTGSDITKTVTYIYNGTNWVKQ